MPQYSLPALLAERARTHPDTPAFTYLDYDLDPNGPEPFPETLTWAQIHNRALVVAAELSRYGSPGDRVAVIAPQGLDYVAGFFGAITAGFIAVPLSVPMFGVHDERISSALADSAPTAIVTTSAVSADVMATVDRLAGHSPAVIEVDGLDLDGPPETVVDAEKAHTKTALLQYTSGSTRDPKGVVVTHRNVIANVDQVIVDYFEGTIPPRLTTVSWLPFYHDMGLLLGIVGPLVLDRSTVLTSPMAFLAKPARWIAMLASATAAFSAAPNFAFELTAARTTEADLAGVSLADVHTILSGAERIHAATLRRFADRFAPVGLPANALAPSYGLAEAMVYVCSGARAHRPVVSRFDYEKLAAGFADPPGDGGGVEVVSVGPPRACTIRVVDTETRTEQPPGQVGEIWLYGDNIADGYWHNQEETHRAFGGMLTEPTAGTPAGPWLHTGDLGVIHDGELYIVGRIKDLLVVDGRNHYPDDIEATVAEISKGRVVAVAISDEERGTEQLVTVVEIKMRGASDEEKLDRVRDIKRKVIAAVSEVHGVHISDFLAVEPGSIPITTSGKVRRAASADIYRQGGFRRVDAALR